MTKRFSSPPAFLFATPPFTQLNTSYPAMSYLTGFMRRNGIEAYQADLGIETFLSLFSSEGIGEIARILESYTDLSVPEAQAFLRRKHEYIGKIDPVIRFLQGKDQSLADRIVNRNFLPEGGRFAQAENVDWAFGSVGVVNHAKYLCTLFLEDIGDVVSHTIDPDFAFSRYAESIAGSASSFDGIADILESGNTLSVDIYIDHLNKKFTECNPGILAFSVPFPGNLLMAFYGAKYIKETYPHIVTVLGGGYVNTELRALQDTRVFSYFDYVTFDDGERPLLQIYKYLQGECNESDLVRTKFLKNGTVADSIGTLPDFDHSQTGWPDYQGLDLDRYLSFIEMTNPMHRLWSDGRWNKMTLAHGCYWHRCTFCDTSLDYIKRYSQADAGQLCDRIEDVIEQTHTSGFHFVDEAAPPALLRELALEILRRGITISWWTNIRFDRSFSADLCRLLALSGCIAVTGGLEVASDRVLSLINKNVSVAQAAKTAYNFTNTGIMVHAYLMYGFPTQTEEETIDSLEVVRQLMEHGLIQSAFWHKFTLTEHSPIAQEPEHYSITILEREQGMFANNDLEHVDATGAHHEKFSEGLRKALYNYMHGLCFDVPVHKWFSRNTKPTTVSPLLVEDILAGAEIVDMPSVNKHVYYLGALPQFKKVILKNGKRKVRLSVQLPAGEESAYLPEPIGWWLQEVFPDILLSGTKTRLSQFQQRFFDAGLVNFSRFLYSPAFDLLCKSGLVIV